MSAQIVQRFGQRSMRTDQDQQDVNPSIGKRTTIMRSSTVFATIIALAAATPVLADDVKVGVGISGWTGFAPLTLAKEAGIFKKNGLDVDDQEDPAEGPPPRDRVGRRPVRRDDGRDLGRLERQRRRDQADLPARQELRRRRHGRAQRHREDRRPEGQDGRGLRARHLALLHAGLDPEEERPVGEGRHGRQPRAGSRPRRPSSPARTTPR